MRETTELHTIAARLVEIIVKAGDQRALNVTLSFGAQRDDSGVFLTDVTLGYRERSVSAKRSRKASNH